MEFASDKPIYRQIADYCCEQVLTGAWPCGGKAPSVRELALDMAVNTHTVLKAYDQLQADGIIAPRRGMGYYTAEDAPARVLELRRRDFYTDTVPALRRQLDLLGISPEELLEHLRDKQ